MWVITTDGFLSVVQDRDDRKGVLVRARALEDLQALDRYQPGLSEGIWTDEEADYPFRLKLPKAAWATIVGRMARDIDYDNFKNAVKERQGDGRAQVYMKVWVALLALMPARFSDVLR